MYKNKIILIHQGALGDRVLVWPLLHALAACLDKAWPGLERLFWGRDHARAWQRALGYGVCPSALSRALEGLYSGRRSPELEGARLVWLCVESAPFAAPDESGGPEITWLFTAPPGGETHAARTVLEQAMQARLLPEQDAGVLLVEARAAWQKMFGGPLAGKNSAEAPVLLLPGAGHRDKQWPLECFAELAKGLRAAGQMVAWVLGPAEKERGMALPEGELVHCPQSLDALAALLRSARLVVGNDSGPMHLGAMYGVPTLALFGPTDPAVWRPLGGEVMGNYAGLDGIAVKGVLEVAFCILEKKSRQ